MGEPLAARLRRETRAAHAVAERSGIMRSILRGRVEPRAYCALLRALHEIYDALESGLVRHAGSPLVAPASIPALYRTAALAADLEQLHGPRWRREVPLCAAAAAYGARLRRLADERPEWLVAHAYVRYLGDLSGGQILRGIVALALETNGGAGLSFYDFGDAETVAALKARFRDALNDLPVDTAISDEIVEEAKLAFALHTRLFEELDGGPGAAFAGGRFGTAPPAAARSRCQGGSPPMPVRETSSRASEKKMHESIHIDHPSKRIRCYVPAPASGSQRQPQRWVCEIDGATFDMGIVARGDRGNAEEERAVRRRALELAGPETGP